MFYEQQWAQALGEATTEKTKVLKDINKYNGRAELYKYAYRFWAFIMCVCVLSQPVLPLTTIPFWYPYTTGASFLALLSLWPFYQFVVRSARSKNFSESLKSELDDFKQIEKAYTAQDKKSIDDLKKATNTFRERTEKRLVDFTRNNHQPRFWF